jgi:NitT/TauT family transport system substrate-binding protein
MGPTIRQFVIAALLSAAPIVLAPTTGMAQSAMLRVGKGQAEPLDFTPVDVGVAQGFFKQRGLDIQIINFAGSAKLQQGLAADAADIGLGSGPELAFVAKGAPVLAVAAFAGPPDDLVLAVRLDLPIKGVADLKGSKVGVSTVGSLTDWCVRQLSRQQGWGNDGIEIIDLGSISAEVAGLRSKNVDGATQDVASALRLEDMGIAHAIVNFGAVVPHFIVHLTFATNKLIETHPDQVRAFNAGWFQSVAWMRTHKDETVQIIAPVMHQTPAIVAKTYDAVMPEFSDTGKFDPEALTVLRRSFVEMGTLTAEPDVSKLYTENFLP